MSRCKSLCGANPRRTLTWLLLVLLLVLAIRHWVGMPALVSGNSMAPTLRPGQFVFVNKLAYHFHPPRRGDLVFIWTGREHIVKRIIGLPGEEVALHQGRLYVNGKLCLEDYVEDTGALEIAAGKIAPDSFVVIGDNRPRTAVALVNQQRLLGKVMHLSLSRRPNNVSRFAVQVGLMGCCIAIPLLAEPAMPALPDVHKPAPTNTITLEMLRQAVASNEAKLDPIRLRFTTTFDRARRATATTNCFSSTRPAVLSYAKRVGSEGGQTLRQTRLFL